MHYKVVVLPGEVVESKEVGLSHSSVEKASEGHTWS